MFAEYICTLWAAEEPFLKVPPSKRPPEWQVLQAFTPDTGNSVLLEAGAATKVDFWVWKWHLVEQVTGAAGRPKPSDPPVDLFHS